MKIGFISIGHIDYVNTLSENVSSIAVKSLDNAGVQIFDIATPVVSQQQAVDNCVSLLGKDVDGIIIFLSTWIECNVAMTVVQELGHLPMLLWGFPMIKVDNVLQSTGSYVSYAMFKGVMERIGKRCSYLLGIPGESDSTETALKFCRAAAAIKRLRRARLGMVGYSSMSIYTGTFDHVLLRTLVGPEIVHIDSFTVINRAKAISKEKTVKQQEYLRQLSPVAENVTSGDMNTAARVSSALLTICEELDLEGINIKCQPEFSKEFGAVACVPVSALSDMGIVGSCEGDMLCTVSMFLLHALSGSPVSYGDSINHVDNVVTLSSCGFIPYSFADKENRLIRKFMPHPGFDGIQNSFVPRPGRMTAMRIVEDIGTYHAIVFTGEALESKLRQGYMPSVDIRIDGDIKELLSHYNGQHYAFTYGDWSKDIAEYCKLIGIKVVSI